MKVTLLLIYVRVEIIDEEGAALIHIGNLAMFGAYGGSNLFHILLDNGRGPTVSDGVSSSFIAVAYGNGKVTSTGFSILNESFAKNLDKKPSLASPKMAKKLHRNCYGPIWRW